MKDALDQAVSVFSSLTSHSEDLARAALIAPHHDTARIQEVHQFLLHCLTDQIEKELA